MPAGDDLLRRAAAANAAGFAAVAAASAGGRSLNDRVYGDPGRLIQRLARCAPAGGWERPADR